MLNGFKAGNKSKALLKLPRGVWKIYDYANRLCVILIPVIWIFAFAWVLYDIGFNSFRSNNPTVNFWMANILSLQILLMGTRWVLELFQEKKASARIFSAFVFLIILFFYFQLLPSRLEVDDLTSNKFLFYKLLLYGGILLISLAEGAGLLDALYKRSLNPALLFVGSFGMLIIAGALLLKLPNATNNGLGFVDALFTSTSAVCVTGLIVVDTATEFTTFGQIILLLLIQVGALGIMTFTGLLGYAMAGSTSIRSQLAFREMFKTERLNDAMKLVGRIVAVTLFFEAIGIAMVYFSLNDELFDRRLEKLFFSIFHSVSAFCNAGFSTYSQGLYDERVRFNYPLQLWLSMLIILGGLGFPILFNLFRYIRIKLQNKWWYLRGSSMRVHIPRLININSRLALKTSAILLLIGFVCYLLFERSGSLAQHPTLLGKIVTSFFGAVTPRTAGFNTVDITTLTLPMTMIYLLLMWIGASPASTGGGIKTTTAAVALLNMASVIQGKDRTEFFRMEIPETSIRKAFAIILLSLMVIGIAVFLISVNDSDKGLIRIAFEVFSAFSTVGLSMNLTPHLSDLSKIVLIVTMFIGRVGVLTMIVALIKQSQQLYYRYPKEDIIF